MIGLIVGVTGAVALVLTLGAFGANPHVASAQPQPGVCGPTDVVFLIDDTGSMDGAINNVKTEAASLIAEISTASDGDFQLGLVTFKDSVVVVDDLAAGNAVMVQNDILALSATGGNGEPESSDEALNTAINGLDVADRPAGKQTGNFNGTFRFGATKIAIIITDARPGGFDDTFTVGEDDVNAHLRALEAKTDSILISAVFVPTLAAFFPALTVQIVDVMTDYANTTGGIFIQTAADGTGTANAIANIIANCGSAAVLAAGNRYCITGTSTGIPWSWTVVSSGGIVSADTVLAGTVPAGGTADAIASAWVDSMSNASPPVVTAMVQVGQPNCFLITPAGQTLTVDICVVTGNSIGCSFNPTVIEVPVSVGGTTELLVGGSDAPASAADGSGGSFPYAAIAGGIAAAAVALAAAGGWYARRRWLR